MAPKAMQNTCGFTALHEASNLAAPLPAESMPTLYTHMLCPYAERVLLTLLELVHEWWYNAAHQP